MNFVYRDPKYPESFIFPAKRLSGAMVSELSGVFVKKFGGISYYALGAQIIFDFCFFSFIYLFYVRLSLVSLTCRVRSPRMG